MRDLFEKEAQASQRKTLRPHQVEAIQMIRHSLARGNQTVVCNMPTGSGKTLTAAKIIEMAQAKGNAVIFTAPAVSLIDQTVAAFRAEGIEDIGVMQANHPLTNSLAREAGWHKATIQPDAKLVLRLIYCPPSNVSTVDDDNIITAHKGARDAFAAVLGINDSQFTTVAERGEKCRFGAVIVHIMEAEA